MYMYVCIYIYIYILYIPSAVLQGHDLPQRLLQLPVLLSVAAGRLPTPRADIYIYIYMYIYIYIYITII